MAGGLFAIDRKYFKKIGEYDMGMDIWGNEKILKSQFDNFLILHQELKTWKSPSERGNVVAQ